jgi:hypothetical protein
MQLGTRETKFFAKIVFILYVKEISRHWNKTVCEFVCSYALLGDVGL